MKNIMTYLSYVPKHFKAIMLLAVVLAVPVAGFALPGDNRATKVYSPGVAGFDYVTFNSFTNVPNIGDERNFVHGKIAGASGGFYDPMTQLRNGDEVMVRIYVHNGADPSLNDAPGNPGIARDVRVSATLPSADQNAQNHTITGFIEASNAQPQIVADTLSMSAENDGYFSLEYVPGSTQLTENVNPEDGLPNSGVTTTTLPDGIATGGVALPDIRGCFDSVRLVTFKVQVNMPRYSVTKEVRHEGTGPGNWLESVQANPGDTLDWSIGFNNLGDTQLNNVAIVDEVPEGLTVVPGTVRVVNSNNPAGYTFPDSAIQANGRQINVDIGDYAPGANAFVYFKTTVNSIDEFACGANALNNRAFATPEGFGAVVDNAGATVSKVCEEEVPPPVTPPPSGQLPSTGPAEVLGSVFGISTMGTTIGSFIRSKRNLKSALLKG